MSSSKPSITLSPNGPLIVNNLENLQNSQGEQIETQATLALCRCGGSKNKPFCDECGTRACESGSARRADELRRPRRRQG